MSSERLHIAQVFDSNYDSPGGVPNYIDTLDDYFLKQGHDSTLIVGETSVEDPRIIALGKTFPFPMNGNMVDVPYPTPKGLVRQTLEAVSPDIIHIGTTYFPTTGGRFLNEAKSEVGVVGTFHVLPYRKSSEVGIRLAGALSRSKHRIDHLFTASPEVQDFAKSTFNLESTIVTCPVDIQRFRDGKRMPEYDDGKINIMFLGRLEERKGIGHLIDALGQLDKPTLDKVRVVVGGRGELLSKLQAKTIKLGLSEVVEFPGRIEEADKPNFLASADITALPATSGESFGIVVVEAMAAGAAVIGGDNPGYRSILAKRTPDTLVDPRNSDDFSKVLSRLINDDVYRKETVEKQQQNLDEYDTSVVGRTIIDIYREVLQKRRS